MSRKNTYIFQTHISERKFRALLTCFCQDLPATHTAQLCSLNRNTVNRLYRLIRTRVAELCELESPFHGEVEIDESY